VRAQRAGRVWLRHPVRTLVVVRGRLADIVERGFISAEQAVDLRRRDRFANYMNLPAAPDFELPESVALLYYPSRCTTTSSPATAWLSWPTKVRASSSASSECSNAGFEVDRDELEPPMD
jgi:hypothetical protein